ncbi:30S ribosomal protein S8 [Candidatus Daviesbacteria bacterium RIFCSPHIGHO2_01_FULL_44_29]|uniref:Small ribosomal subunit protein uS8 n=1 Tax=Candidatus Daviesbacteria bacterium RIFCSPHIGHO2_02_FULL_43_12 TaxID=1797776 RepID=A0A1F5KG67_9BACT|nr:MAG: 30S ribosomal protein S8 [Candidatus Daviesbacteria bacterium RIFCSPHIGHO2_01_FULL_44_29]OGE39943.1 MAG: 30S ribosomal protein S8 [Candidatus Daviesbacteria bacterium RIFCSPHIGHO2_02_FULL_43_12]OGE70376.1 MAG: 30S ribosomal protein S8 [Candidatus Daviesbacteria bacterium RIFCSPLOWO2_01_FULL_43_15]
MVTDPIGDSLIRIKNGYMASKEEVYLSYSKLILAIVTVLEKEGYITKFKVEEQKKITVNLKYAGRVAALTDVKRISKPGLRVYKGSKDLPRVLGGLGIALVSTPKGILTDKQARKEGVGGEILAYVW